MTVEKKWYAVYTKPKWEKKTASLFTKKGIENFCPVMPVIKQWADRKKTILEPLFTSYVFVRISMADYIPALETEGAVYFVKQSGKPASISDEEIEDVRLFLTRHSSITVQSIGLHVNDRVRITAGALQAVEGEVKEVRKKTACVLLSSIGLQLVAELDKDSLQKIAG